MICGFTNCDGYVLLHTEGASCQKCCRLQDSVFESGARIEESPERDVIHEIGYLIDNHIISRECGEHAHDLFKIVRSRKINYSHNELVALCVCQAVSDKYGLAITVVQISHILSFRCSEKSFRRKQAKLCEDLPRYFCNQKIHTPPLAIFTLGIPRWKIKRLHLKCKKLMSKGNYSFSYEAALLCELEKGGFTRDSNLINFICSFPASNEVIKCRQLLTNVWPGSLYDHISWFTLTFFHSFSCFRKRAFVKWVTQMLLCSYMED